MLRSWVPAPAGHVPAFACGAGWSAKPLSGTREDEAGADEGGKRRSDSTYTFLRPLPKVPGPFEACSSSSNLLDLPQSQRCLWQPEGSRRGRCRRAAAEHPHLERRSRGKRNKS